MFKNNSTDSARDLQTPGPELWRHDLTVHFFSKHPCLIPVFKAQIDACESEEEEHDVIYQWWTDNVPAYIRYSNRGKDTPRSAWEARQVAVYAQIGGAK